jgi:hypothetical protein
VGNLALVLLLLIVPGLPATLALARPGRMSVVTRMALVLVFGSAIVGAAAFVPAILHVLNPVVFFVLVGGVSVGLSVWVARRDGFRAHAREAWSEIKADPWPIVLGVAVLVGIALVRSTFDPRIHFSDAPAWRYWADGIEVADAGRIPELSLQHGMTVAPTVSKAFLNALTAGVSFLVGRTPLPAFASLLWMGAVGAAAALWAVGRELGLRWTAPALPVLLLANQTIMNTELTTDMDGYRAETFGRLLAFGALVLAIRAFREHGRRTDAVVAGLVFGAAAGVHLVPVIATGIIAGLVALAVFVREEGRRETAVRAGLAGVVALASVGALLILPRGDVGLSGGQGDAVYAGFEKGFDPTLFVFAGATPAEQAAAGPRDWSLSPWRAYRAFVASFVRQPLSTGLRARQPPRWVAYLAIALAILLPLIALAILRWAPRPIRPVGVAAVGLMAIVTALAWWFSNRSTVFIPANFGLRRLYDYSSIPVVLIGLALIELALVGLVSKLHPRATLAAATAFVLVVGIGLMPDARLRPTRDGGPRATALTEPLTWIGEHLPCDARILVNQHSAGFFQSGLGRVAILEGGTPYLRPALLETIVDLYLGARDFYHGPAANRAFLDETGATHVVYLRREGIGYLSVIGRPPAEPIDAAPFLERIYASQTAIVWRVRDPAPPAGLPQAEDFPGYHCVRDPDF